MRCLQEKGYVTVDIAEKEGLHKLNLSGGAEWGGRGGVGWVGWGGVGWGGVMGGLGWLG